MIKSNIKLNLLVTILLAFCLVSCSKKDDKTASDNTTNEVQANTIPVQTPPSITQYRIEIVDTLPHNPNFYTQGLAYFNGKLYEGTGQQGQSALVRYNDNYNVDKTVTLSDLHFGEGIAILKNNIYQLTWLNQTCFVYDLKSLKQTNSLKYMGEGWGLTNNDSLLIMSDGSATIKFIEPSNFKIVRQLKVTKNSSPLRYLNELELVDSLLYINVYMQDLIVIANINTGEVVGEIDISNLRTLLLDNPTQEVSNGIAYNPKTGLFYLTGKYWNKIFIVKFHKV